MCILLLSSPSVTQLCGFWCFIYLPVYLFIYLFKIIDLFILL